MPPLPPGPGDSLGRYKLEREIGRGGMGVVYLAHDTELDRRVALKVINPDVGDDPEFRVRFQREMRIAAKLEHPNIVPVYDEGEIDGLLFIAMRYVDGADLRAALRRTGPVDLSWVAQAAKNLGNALDYAHAQGLVHRDIKPANVLISDTAGVHHLYLTDFGLARETASDSGLTNTGQWIGTVDYVAPEQLAAGVISARTDVYAMACVLYEVITGRVPYEGTVARKLFAQTSEPLPSVGSVAGPAGPQIDAVLRRATAKDPAGRFPSAGDLGRALSGAISGEAPAPERSVATGVALSGIATQPGRRPSGETRLDPVVAPVQPPPPPPPPAPATRRRPAVVAAAAIGVLAALAAGGAVAVALTAGGDEKPATRPARAVAPVRDSQSAVRIRIVSPASGAEVSGDHVAIRGTVTPANAAVTIRGTPAAVGNGQFVADVSLKPGENSIDVIGSAPGTAPTSEVVLVRRKAAGTTTPATTTTTTSTTREDPETSCGAHTTHADNGAAIEVTDVTALGTACSEAFIVIDKGPSGRASSGWNCPITGNAYYTSCANGSRRVTWRIPSGSRQTTQPTSCSGFTLTDDSGKTFTASNIAIHGISCSTARATIRRSGHGRRVAGWICPVTGNPHFTSCTRGSQRLSWKISF